MLSSTMHSSTGRSLVFTVFAFLDKMRQLPSGTGLDRLHNTAQFIFLFYPYYFQGNARLKINGNNNELVVRELLASGQGWLELDATQTWKISHEDDELRIAVNMLVHEGGLAIFPPSLTVHGTTINIFGESLPCDEQQVLFINGL